MRLRLLVFIVAALSACASASAQTWPAGQTGEEVARARPTWPFSLSASLYIGLQATPNPKGDLPVAFGALISGLWRNTVGVSGGILSAAGSRVLQAKASDGTVPPAPPDRISVPISLAVRPFAPMGWSRTGWAARMASSFEVQIGPSVEHIRTADTSHTFAAFSGALAMDVPLYLGSAVEGGVAFRVMLRGIAAPDATLSAGALKSSTFTGQAYFGLIWYP